MKLSPALLSLVFASGTCGIGLTGCSLLPEATSDPTRFYVLSTDAVRTAPQPAAPVVHLREIELASYLKSRPVVVRRGNNEIEFREFALWGETLDLGIARVLREELLARGKVSAVTSSLRRELGSPEVTLTVRVLACEGAASGAIVFRAVWELARIGTTPGPIGQGDYRPTDLRWDGKNEATLAEQLSAAVSGLAGEISAALAK